MYKQTKYDELVKPYVNDLMRSIGEFVAIDSVNRDKDIDEVNPFGPGVTEALNYIANLAKKDGFKVTNYDNMIVEILVGNGEKNITIMAHADVVPEGLGWPHFPFEVREENGVLTGRGVADDKGPLLETYYALKALRDNNLLGNYQVRFLVGGNEESGSRGMIHYFEDLKMPQPTLGFSPDAEYPLIYAEKGISNFEVKGRIDLKGIDMIHAGFAFNAVPEDCTIITSDKAKELVAYFEKNVKGVHVSPTMDGRMKIVVPGKSAHGSTPEEGINAGMIALTHLAKFFDNKDLQKLVDAYTDTYGRGLNAYNISSEMDNQQNSFNVGIIEYKNNELKMVVNFRYVDTCDYDLTIKNIKESSKPFDVEVTSNAPLLFYKKSSDLVQILLKTYQEETGDYESKPKAIGGGTYAKEAQNVVAFGAEFPGWDSKMHGVLEGSKKEDIIKSMAIYAHAIYELGKKIEE